MKNTNYCIIDHVGTIEDQDDLRACYKKAYEINEHDKKQTYKMKEFCKKIYNIPGGEPNDGHKFKTRFDKHPEEVIFICDEYKSKPKWTADIWAEKVDNLKILEAATIDAVTTEYLTLKDIHPEWFATIGIDEDTIYRRCASIWGHALGWSFSAPLYKDDTLIADGFYRAKSNPKHTPENYQINKKKELEMKTIFFKNCPSNWTKNQKEKAWEKRLGLIKQEAWKNTDKRVTTSKIASRPASYIKAKTIASEEECKAFFEYYKYLYLSNSLEASLEPGYQLCPHCGKPIAIDKASLILTEIPDSEFKSTLTDNPREKDRTCSNCDIIIPAELINDFDPYYDDSYNEDEANGYLDDPIFNTYDDAYNEDKEDWD